MTWFPRGLPWVSESTTPPPIPGPNPPNGSGEWPTCSPEEQGVSSAALDRVKAAYIGDAILIRNGFNIREWGDARGRRGFASCARSVVASTDVGVGIQLGDIVGGFAVIDRLLTDLGVPIASQYKPGTYLHHPCSYTRPGEGWGYAKDWRIFDDLFAELDVHHRRPHDYFNEKVRPYLPGIDAKENSADGTPRFDASPYHAARWAWLWLNWGLIDGVQLVSPEYVQRSIAGGPLGDGQPDPLEGYQIHLIRDGMSWELDMTGVPDGFMARDGGRDPNNPEAGGGSHGAIIGIPSLNIALAYRSLYPCDYFMRAVCEAVVA